MNKKFSEFTPELIAPCGMNCGICSAYLAFSRNIPKKRGISHCTGCRPRNKLCAFLKRRCQRLMENRISFCFECEDLPCHSLSHIDERYRRNYNMSMVDNLRQIEREGMEAFLKDQREKYRCPSCGGVICIHNGKCYDCQTVETWRG